MNSGLCRYTAQGSVDDVLNSIKNHKSLQAYHSGGATGLLAFGNGDGGGGATADMLESLRRCRATADRSGELPKVTMGGTVDEFYEDIMRKTENGATLPTWDGELVSSDPPPPHRVSILADPCHHSSFL